MQKRPKYGVRVDRRPDLPCCLASSLVGAPADLKPANILIKSSPGDPRGWTCKLADFGFALLLDQMENSDAQQQLQQPLAVSAVVIWWVYSVCFVIR